MAELPDVTEHFIADMERYSGPIRDAADYTEEFAAVVDRAHDSVDGLADGLARVNRSLASFRDRAREDSTAADTVADAFQKIVDRVPELEAGIDSLDEKLSDLKDHFKDAASAARDLGTNSIIAGGETAAAGAAAGNAGRGGLAIFAGGWQGIAIGIAAAISLLGGFIPALAAAGAGIAAVGAVAFPVFSAISDGLTAVTNHANKVAQDKAWDKIPEALRPVVRAVLDLERAFEDMAAAFQPQVLKIVSDLLTTAGHAIGAIAQLAGPAFAAITPFFNALAQSSVLDHFVDVLARLEGPALTGLGQFIQILGTGLIKFVEQLAPAMAPAISAILTITKAFVTLLPAIAKIIVALAPIAPAFAKVLLVFANTLAKIVTDPGWDGIINNVGKIIANLLLLASSRSFQQVINAFTNMLLLIITNPLQVQLVNTILKITTTLLQLANNPVFGRIVAAFSLMATSSNSALGPIISGLEGLLGLISNVVNALGGLGGPHAPLPAGSRGGQLGGGGGGGGRTTTVVVNNHIAGSVLAQQDLANHIVDTMNKQTFRNFGSQLYLPGRTH